MKKVLEYGLKQIDINEPIKTYHAVSGGDINEAYYVHTASEEFFVKLNQNATAEFFAFEKRGLDAIEQSNTIAVPQVYGVVTEPDSNVPMLWLKWVEGSRKPDTDMQLGEQLAQMHQTTQAQYGLDGKSYVGSLEQHNDWTDSWLTYYRDYRLRKQLELGREYKTITGKREKKLVQVIRKLDHLIPECPQSSLLHGDLWGGNWMAGEAGRPYVIDPSLLYGDHEFEIAFTRLFGGFSETFYEAYRTAFPLSDTYQDKEPIYQLYYLLVHLNMFGEVYGGAVDRILDRYAG